jgi:hypothetical protein
VSERIANILVLGEDGEHQNLVRRYLLHAGHEGRSIRLLDLPSNRGSGSQYVREQFSKQVLACRKILGQKTRCLLIVITDADNLTVSQRERTLHDACANENQVAVAATEPIAILIPKWQVETWIKCLLGETMSEDDSRSDEPPVSSKDIQTAARILFDWSRANAQAGETCVESLKIALPRWQRISSRS